MASIKTMTSPLEIHYLTRIEGHGNIVIDIHNGTVLQCDLEVIEAPRYFEAMLRNKPYGQVQRIASRICGICAVAHSTASIKALESAMNIEISPQTALLRKLILCAEMIDSHILHGYMLVAPDFFKAGSVIPLLLEYPDVVKRALRIKQGVGQICGLIGGRHTHPIAMTVGGFTHLPTEEELQNLYHQLEGMARDIEATIDLFSDLIIPNFERDTEYLALDEEGGYGYFEGLIASSDGGHWPVERYREVVNEYQISHSTAKHTRHQRSSYMVGALARFNLNYDKLCLQAKTAAQGLDLRPICRNPFMITVAQVVEIAHFYQETLRIIEELLEVGIHDEGIVQPVRLSGEGVGACEAPRGTLYHHYVLRNGIVVDANCVIPTGQNLANIEADMRMLAPQIWNRPKDEIKLTLEMLVRAYDPCISCSTHMLQVQFV